MKYTREDERRLERFGELVEEMQRLPEHKFREMADYRSVEILKEAIFILSMTTKDEKVGMLAIKLIENFNIFQKGYIN